MEFTAFDYFKMMYSVGLVIFSIIIVTALMFEEKTSVAQDASPVVALVVMWLCILWMSMVEGGQCSMVGLPPIDRELYKDSHKITWKICSLGHRGDNLDRYLMGRQFLVIFINFTISLCGAPLAGAEVLNLPDWLTDIFLVSGIAMVLTNVNIGQLTAQCNASHCMLDYINTHFMTFTLYVCLFVEATGVMHVCYLIRDSFYWGAGKPVESKEPPRTALLNVLHWGRVLFSIAVLVFALAVTFEALFDDKTAVWDGTPYWVAVILFVGLMCIVGMLEGMQIAFFTVSKLTAAERGNHPMAVRTCELLFRGEGRNLPGFMVGRQMTVTLCFFIIARVTSIQVKPGTGENIFNVPDGVQVFFNLGFLGAIVTTILASISWQLVAGAFPLQFLSNPLVYVLLNAALLLEFTGICHASWFFGILHKAVAGFQLDEVYVGTAEERALRGKPDAKDAMTGSMGTNMINTAETFSPEFLLRFSGANYTAKRAKIMKNILDFNDLRLRAKALEEGPKQAVIFNDDQADIIEEAYGLDMALLSNINDAQRLMNEVRADEKKRRETITSKIKQDQQAGTAKPDDEPRTPNVEDLDVQWTKSGDKI